jgi:hypothetical protein
MLNRYKESWCGVQKCGGVGNGKILPRHAYSGVMTNDSENSTEVLRYGT